MKWNSHWVLDYVNVPWEEINAQCCGLYNWVNDDGYPIETESYTGGQYHLTIEYKDSTPCTITDATVNYVYIKFDFVGNQSVFIYIRSVTQDSESRAHYLYVDPAVSEGTTQDNSNAFMFKPGSSSSSDPQRYFQAIYETNAYGDLPDGGVDTEASVWSEMPMSGDYAALEIDLHTYHYPGNGYYETFWVNKCTSCTQESGSQYTDGPWDGDWYNDEEIEGQDIIFVHKVTKSSTTTDWTTTYKWFFAP